MKKSLFRKVIIAGLSTYLSAATGIGPASAQEPASPQAEASGPDVTSGEDPAFEQEPTAGQGDDFLDGNVPDWLESYGYEDTHDDVPDGRGAALGAGGNNSPKCKCLLCRDTLTGDWHGRRSALQQEGILYRGRVTQFFMGVGGGVNPPVPPQFEAFGIAGGDTFEYTGNSRHDFLLSLDKFGGLPHSKFAVTMENVWGRWGNVSFETGGLSPAVFNAVQPVDTAASGSLYCTNFMLIQPLSERFVVTAGKTRTIGVADNNIFAGGDGSDQFLNQTFVANPLMVPQIPFSTFVVGALMPREWGNISLSVMDPEERSTEFMDVGTLFRRGAIAFGQVQFDTEFFAKPGEVHFGGFYKKTDELDLRFTTAPPEYPYPPAAPGTPQFLTLPETYAIFTGFDQYMVTYGPPDARGNTEGWGLFGRAGIADGATGNPNWGAWHASLGIGGNSPIKSRRGKGDRFGIGYAYTGTSTEFGAIPRFLFDPRDAQIIESYYRYQVTPAIELTPDIQWVHGMLSGLTDGDDAIVAGIRMNMKL